MSFTKQTQDPGKTKVITISQSKKKASHSSSSSLDIDFLNQVTSEDKTINDFIVTYKQQNYSNDKFQHENQEIMSALAKIASQKKNKFAFTLFILKPLFDDTQYYLFCLDHFFTVPVETDNQIRIIGKFKDNVVVLQRNMNSEEIFDFEVNQALIIEPTTLISPSHINGVQYCHRQSLLKSLFSYQDASEVMFIGVACHDFFEFFMQHKNPLNQQEQSLIEAQIKQQVITLSLIPSWIMSKIKDIYQTNILTAFQLNMSFQEFTEKIIKMCIRGLKWIDTHIYKQEPIRLESNKYSKTSQSQRSITILQVVEVEKFLDSQEFGFCGKLDAIIKCSFHEIGKPSIEQLVPFEIKTGKPAESYKYQTIIYSILMKKSHELNYLPTGLLYYMSDNSLIEVKPQSFYVEQVFFQRNFIAQSFKQVTEQGKLPQIVNKEFCDSCFLNQACSSIYLLNQEIENTIPEYKIFDQILNKLKKKSLEYFQKYMKLLFLEERASTTEMNLQGHIFQSSCRSIILSWIENLLFMNISKNCFIDLQSQLYNEKQVQVLAYQYCIGEIITIQNDEIQFKVNCKIDSTNIIKQNNDLYQLNIKIEAYPPKSYYQKSYELIKSYYPQTLNWTIRRRDYNPFPIMRTAILDLLVNDEYEKKKDVIVSGISQESETQSSSQILALKYLDTNFKDYLNQGQYEAIKKSILCDVFQIILGFPGTGKTFVIAHLIYLLSLVGYKILVISYTHCALDNILDQFYRLFPSSIDTCVRMGSDKNKISETGRTIHFDPNQFSEASEIEQFLLTKFVFFTTCLSANDRILKMQHFDYCIVDEASQIIEPLCVSNILQGDRFILIGDYLQLQPIVKCNEAKSQLSISLLQRLAQSFPNRIEKLTVQFRMNEDIMRLSNNIIYDNQLKIFNDTQAKQQLMLNPSFKENETNEVVRHFLSPECSVIFINYQHLVKNTKSHEQLEIDLVRVIVQKLLIYSLQVSNLAIIASYNRQLYRIQKDLNTIINLQILTIDKSQGIDKDCIIVVCSQNNEGDSHLLQNKRRINVAFTRAKRKLIIIGNEEYLNSFDNIKPFLSLMRKMNWIVDLSQMLV